MLIGRDISKVTMIRIRAITVNTAIAKKLIELFNLVYTLYDIIYMTIVMRAG
jgi:hypothetical protein